MNIPVPTKPGITYPVQGFTLPEAIIAFTLFVLLVGGIVGANLFGMRLFQLTDTKLQASSGARRALGQVADEIRESANIQIGNISNGTFVALLDTEPQKGGALLLRTTTNTAPFICYFLNSIDGTFRRSFNGATSPLILASGITNTEVFQAIDLAGNTLTNAQANHVVRVTLEFYQQQRWLPVPDYFKLETAVTRRIY
jgi:hypothetical protein